MLACQPSDVNCPTRLLFDQITGKWSMMALSVLDAGPVRFNGTKRHSEGLTWKALTRCLRRLERNGLVSRRVIMTSPIGIEYAIMPLGFALLDPFQALHARTVEHLDEVEGARKGFDGNAAA